MIDMRPVDGINLLILLVLVWILFRVVNDEGNLIIWADYIASMGSDGRQHGDPNKLLQLMGGVVACVVVLVYARSDRVDGLGLTGVLTAVLGFCAGPVMWAANLRSKQQSITTTKVEEPAADPATRKITETKQETK